MKHVLMAVLNIMDKKSIIGDLPQFYVFNPNQVERMPISTGFIILVNDKIRMFAEEPQPQEYSIRRTLKYDTSTFHLPRQYTYVAVPICVECLILLGFSRVRGK